MDYAELQGLVSSKLKRKLYGLIVERVTDEQQALYLIDDILEDKDLLVLLRSESGDFEPKNEEQRKVLELQQSRMERILQRLEALERLERNGE